MERQSNLLLPSPCLGPTIVFAPGQKSISSGKQNRFCTPATKQNDFHWPGLAVTPQEAVPRNRASSFHFATRTARVLYQVTTWTSSGMAGWAGIYFSFFWSVKRFVREIVFAPNLKTNCSGQTKRYCSPGVKTICSGQTNRLVPGRRFEQIVFRAEQIGFRPGLKMRGD